MIDGSQGREEGVRGGAMNRHDKRVKSTCQVTMEDDKEKQEEKREEERTWVWCGVCAE